MRGQSGYREQAEEHEAPKLVVPSADESKTLLEWLESRTPTHAEAAWVCHMLAVLHAIVILTQTEAHVDVAGGIVKLEAYCGVLFGCLVCCCMPVHHGNNSGFYLG
ncbi:MAG TPA: hypothetical protein VGI24_05955 [Solirubrobacteraceae bacterium]|jgi:hypothetical protein